MQFSELKIKKGLKNAIEDIGFVKMTEIQDHAFAKIKSGKDFIGIAQTGTGKTWAYLLPILDMLDYSRQYEPRVMIIAPTRELVMQIYEELEKLTAYSDVRIVKAYGGTNINTQKKGFIQGSDIVVATPGRILDLIYAGTIRANKIRQFVLDEVDEMFELGFRPQIKALLDLIKSKHQNIMFSATLDPSMEEIIQIFFNHYEKVEIVPHGTPLDLIEQYGYHTPNFNTKTNLLRYLLTHDFADQKTLIFVKSKKMADFLYSELNDENLVGLDLIHGNKAQNKRFLTIEKFESGEINKLIATDIIARGLDITEIDVVINFDFPTDANQYIHRIGRTGRAEKNGLAYSFILESDAPFVSNAEDLMQHQIEILPLPETVEISSEEQEFEKVQIVEKNYLQLPDSMKKSKGAFQEKKKDQSVISKQFRKRKKARPKKRSGRR